MMKDSHNHSNSRISRKIFLKKTGLLALGASLCPWALNIACSGRPAEAETAGDAMETAIETEVSTTVIAKNAGPYDLTRKAIKGLGGMGKFV